MNSRRWSTIWPRWLFFFQAEDGIRDLTVTGVQTCALPISLFSAEQVLRDIHRALDNRKLDGPDDLNAYLQTLQDRKSTRLNSSHSQISYAVFCLKKKQDLFASELHRLQLAPDGARRPPQSR